MKTLTVASVFIAWLVIWVPAGVQAAPPSNLMANGSFETGREPWRMDCAGKTAARLALEEADAGAGQVGARVTIEAVESWGVQFGQSVDELQQGKTYTYAVLAKSVRDRVPVKLEIERRGQPYDRAAQDGPYTLTSERWTELHVTFQVTKAFPQGCFAYVSCDRAGADFRVDGFRLYEGPYVPFAEAAKEEMAAAAVRLFDTGAAAEKPIPAESLERRDGWTELAEDDTTHAFSGAAVLMNDRLAVVVRRGAAGADLYGHSETGFHLRSVLGPARTDAVVTGVTVDENGPSAATIDVAFRASDGTARGLRCELSIGQPFLRTEPLQGTAGLAVNATCRYAVLPDFFADDIVIDARELHASEAELPCENFLLHLLPGGDSLLMTVATHRDDDVLIKVTDDHQFQRTEIPFGDRGRIWVALLESPGVWHERAVAKQDAGKSIALDWTAPFAAQWRVDWRQADSLTGSWEMVAERADGQFERYSWLGSPETVPSDRLRWTTVLGRFPYPCWLDTAGKGYLQPFSKKPVSFEGPAVIYPINRVRQTPLDRFTITDIMRGTLGVGPCEYILDLEGQRAAMRGRATCATRDALKVIYGAKQQKQRRAEIEQILTEVVTFVKHIRGRIEQYQTFSREMLEYLGQQRREHPELASFLDEMESLARVIQNYYERRQAEIRTPEYVIGLTDEFRKNVLDYEGDDALDKCNRITNAIVQVGGNQDELVGECRMAVKVLRQRAGMAMATDPRTAPIAREIRRRTQQSLRNPTTYEAPRH